MFAKLKITAIAWLAALVIGLPNAAAATDLDISNIPLFLATSVDANVVFILDDSGSMHWETMPDELTNIFNRPCCADYLMLMFPFVAGIHGGSDYSSRRVVSFNPDSIMAAAYRNSRVNTVFYNPAITYRPWVNADGTFMPAADPQAAYHNPVRTNIGTRNLTVDATASVPWVDNRTNSGITQLRTFFPATYFRYTGPDFGNLPAAIDDPTSPIWTIGNYQRVEIRPGNAPFTGDGRENRSDCADAATATCTYAEEIQNFANWYTYHRNRIFAARAGIGLALSQQSERLRIGYGTINATNTMVDGRLERALVRGVRNFDAATREAIFDALYMRPIPTQGTPLRTALQGAGEYFSRSDDRGPWSTTPGQPGGEILACRQSFTILMTDGYWNGAHPAGITNTDNQSGPTILAPDGSSFQYTPSDPFRDAHSRTLADVAMHYWKRDLLPSVPNRVPTTPLNPAFWQHMVTFGVGLGVQGSIDPDEAFAAIHSGLPIAWPQPSVGGRSENIDDLLHAGVNSRGGFFSAMDAETFSRELAAVLQDIVARAAATTGVAVSATRLTTDAFVYTADFDSNNWTGQVRALNPDDGALEWSAADALDSLGAAARNIFSFDPAGGTAVPFTAASTVIADRLMNPAPSGGDWSFANLVNYLRGADALEERNGGSFRDRDSLLATVVNSRPVFSGRGNEGWARAYADYIDYIDGAKRDPRDCGSPCNKRETVFIGGNGGMLHAFDGRTGVEHFAYVPSAVHHNLHQLADPGYNHRFFVDGQIAIADARIGSGAQAWRTVLVGGLGAGGRGIYALDVTEPQNFDASKVLWEFTHEDDPDLGFTFGEPIIARLENGDWVAVFGNGYNSQSNRAHLFVLDLATGAVRNKIALGAAGGNGLSGVAGWRDVGTRTHLERVYAGDLKGTMWRVDFNASTPSVTYANGLFTDPHGRPITATPTLAAHPGGGLVVYFGSGQLIENADRLTVNLERFYALRDRGSAVGNNAAAMKQFAKAELALGPTIPGQPPMRTVTNTDGIKPNGWFVDLAVGAPTGERILAPPRVVFGRVVIASYEPVEDPCQPGGIQRAYVLDALSGDGALPFCPNCGGIEIGAGAPFSPPIAIRPQQPGTGAGVVFPGWDPSDPLPPLPPDPTGAQTTRGWCSEFGIPPLFVGGTFLSLGTICEGRQVWRQIR